MQSAACHKVREVRRKLQKMLVVVFDDEVKAHEGYLALKDLDKQHGISVHALAVVRKNQDGSLTSTEIDNAFPIRTIAGTAIGALIGLLGGRTGAIIGALGGLTVGAVLDLDRSHVNAAYLEEVSATLTPGRWAVVSDISEERENPVDSAMEMLGGTVFRANRVSVEKEKDAKDEAALKSQIADLKEELTKAKAEDRAKIQQKIYVLYAKLQARQQEARLRSELRKIESDAKVRALQEKAKNASDDIRAKLEARIASLSNENKEPAAEDREAIAPAQTEQ